MTHPPYEPYPTSSAYPSYPAHDPRSTPPVSKTQAGWALGLSLIPILITLVIAVVLAIGVLRDCRDGRDHGKKMAIGALCVVAGWIVLISGIVVAVYLSGAERDSSGDVTESGSVAVTALGIGDCLPEMPDVGEQLRVDVVPCSDPHRGEVYAEFDLKAFTTQDEVDRTVERTCTRRFTGFMGLTYPESQADVVYFRPLSSRAFGEDAGATCLVFVDEEVTGSLAGARR